MKKSYGLFVGINYPGTSSELAGCVNDANTWGSLFGPLCDGAVAVLHDADATRKNILGELAKAAGLLRSGDVLYFTYSGHGSWLPDASGDEPDGRDECICPVDYTRGMILDDDLDAAFSSRRRGSLIIYVSDSCFSGTVFRMVGDPLADDGRPCRRPRFLPPSEWMPKSKRKAAEEFAVRAAMQPRARSNAAKAGLIVLSGCKDTEYSYDAYIDGKSCGAFTYNLVCAWGEVVGTAGHTYRDVWAALLKRLPSYEYPQTPRLNATAADAKRTPFQ